MNLHVNEKIIVNKVKNYCCVLEQSNSHGRDIKSKLHIYDVNIYIQLRLIEVDQVAGS